MTIVRTHIRFILFFNVVEVIHVAYFKVHLKWLYILGYLYSFDNPQIKFNVDFVDHKSDSFTADIEVPLVCCKFTLVGLYITLNVSPVFG